MCTCLHLNSWQHHNGAHKGGEQPVLAMFYCRLLRPCNTSKPSQPTISAYCCFRHHLCCPPAIFCPVSVAFAPRDHLVNWAFIVDFVAGTLFSADVVFNFSCGYVITVGGCGAAGWGGNSVDQGRMDAHCIAVAVH